MFDPDPASKDFAIANELVETVAEESLALNMLDAPAPRYLCHYTDFSGLKGILSSGQLWFSDTKTLNDSVELEYGRGLVAEYLKDNITGVEEDLVMQSGLNHPYRLFVSCFCESSSVLSMWRNYARRGGGYCLEFDGFSLQQCRFPPQANRLPFKMTYTNKLSKEARALIDKLMAWGRADADRAKLVGVVLNYLPVKFKHPAFSEEREW